MQQLMDRYSLYLKNDEFFEDLVWHICSRLFGMGVSKFPPGKDGGKDGRFIGTAQAYPDTVAPWSGKIIIQAKHTKSINASCSTAEFKAIMNLEKTKIKALKKKGELTHYICFTNRKRSGVKADELERALQKECDLENLVIVGIDTIEQWLAAYPDLIDRLQLAQPAPGLTIHPEDLEKIILHFDQNLDLFDANQLVQDEPMFQYTQLSLKNRINGLSDEYFTQFIEAESMPYMRTIDKFLKDPRNKDWLKRYNNVAFHLRHSYALHREHFKSFEMIFGDVLNRLHLHGQIPGNERLASIFLHYMYCFCDFGRRTPEQ